MYIRTILAKLTSDPTNEFKPYNYKEQDFRRLAFLFLTGGLVVSPLFCYFISVSDIPRVYFDLGVINAIYFPLLVVVSYFVVSLREKIVSMFIWYLFGISIYAFSDVYNSAYTIKNLFCFLALFSAIIYVLQRTSWTIFYGILILSLLLIGSYITPTVPGFSRGYFGLFFLISFIVTIVLISRNKMINGVEDYSDYLKQVVNNPGVGYVLLKLTELEAVVVDSNKESIEMLAVDEMKMGEKAMDLLKVFPSIRKKILNLPVNDKIERTVEIEKNGVKHFLDINFSTIPLKNGIYTLMTLVDVTFKMNEQEQLKYRETKYRRLFEFSNDIILLLDDERIVDINNKGKLLLGITIESSTNFFSLSAEQDSTKFIHIKRELKEKGVVQFTWLINGVNSVFEGNVILSGISFGEKQYVQCVIHDVSLEHKLSREMLRAEIAEESNKKLEREIKVRIQAEKQLEDQYLRSNAIFESSSNTFMLTLGVDHSISSFNTHAAVFIRQLTGEECFSGQYLEKYAEHLLEPIELRFMKRFFHRVSTGISKQMEVRFIRENQPIWLELYMNPIFNSEGKTVEISLVAHDITSKKINENELISSLKEKEILLKEIHHRVKNNLQVISSILNLQSSFVEDKKILEVLEESRNRIRSMAVIHENLYRTDNFSSINFTEYLKNLVANLISSYQVHSIITLEQELDVVELTLDQAVPMGLLVNELVTNAIKYAFPNGEPGIIGVQLKQEATSITLVIKDNGVGLPIDFDMENTNTLGLQLVTTLVYQLEGQLSLQVRNGTEFLITFEKV